MKQPPQITVAKNLATLRNTHAQEQEILIRNLADLRALLLRPFLGERSLLANLRCFVAFLHFVLNNDKCATLLRRW